MSSSHQLTDAAALTVHLKRLRQQRLAQKNAVRARRGRRQRLDARDRRAILRKTDGRCHVCGGEITDRRWQADHVLAHSGGGQDTVDNYLPAHALCNNYRWDYLAEEFRYVLKIGVWARTQIERETPIGREIAERFGHYEAARLNRRRPSRT